MTQVLNPYKNYSDTKTRRCQILYLYHCMNETVDRIAEIVNYAYSTVRQYLRKFSELLEEAKKMFTPNKGKVYFVKFYDEQDNFIFTKVGKTTRTMKKRMNELLDDYYQFGVRKVKIERVIDCPYFSEDGLERFVQSLIIRDFPYTLIPNDRFSKDVPCEVFDEYVKMYLG